MGYLLLRLGVKAPTTEQPLTLSGHLPVEDSPESLTEFLSTATLYLEAW